MHDLHIWAMSTTETALTAHLMEGGHADSYEINREAARQLRERFGIVHTTLQWERPGPDGGEPSDTGECPSGCR